jgi:hypothetical protein
MTRKNMTELLKAKGKLSWLQAILIKIVTKSDRDFTGCIYEIKVYDKEDYDKLDEKS